MTTHKPVTEADIAAALARVLRGTNYVPFAEADDAAATIATRLWAALPEPEPTAREDGLDGRFDGYREGRATVWREVVEWAAKNLAVAEHVLSHEIVTSDDVRGILDPATSSQPAAPESRAALQQALDWFTVSAAVYFDTYGTNDEPIEELHVALAALS